MRSLKRSVCLTALFFLVGCGSGEDVAFNPSGVPVPPPATPTSFVDPTANLQGVALERAVYIAPFAQVRGTGNGVRVGAESNIQDNVIIDGEVVIGEKAILAHGCRVQGPATIGASGGRACFVGFNALVDRGTVEQDAMVGIRARLGPGVVLRAGRKILPGKNVTTQAEADQPALGKVADVTEGDRRFMHGVLEVNTDLVQGYLGQQMRNPALLRGISLDAVTRLHPEQIAPRLAGKPVIAPEFPNRIIGDVQLEDTIDELLRKMGSRNSLRADEGGPFHFGKLASTGDNLTVHALEHSEISVGQNLRVGRGVVIHGGEDINNRPPARTQIGDNVVINDDAVVFRSTIGDGCVIGAGALVDGCQLAPGTVVPAKAILIQNQNLGTVEW